MNSGGAYRLVSCTTFNQKLPFFVLNIFFPHFLPSYLPPLVLISPHLLLMCIFYFTESCVMTKPSLPGCMQLVLMSCPYEVWGPSQPCQPHPGKAVRARKKRVSGGGVEVNWKRVTPAHTLSYPALCWLKLNTLILQYKQNSLTEQPHQFFLFYSSLMDIWKCWGDFLCWCIFLSPCYYLIHMNFRKLQDCLTSITEAQRPKTCSWSHVKHM